MPHEPDLEELLRDDDVMEPVMRSARVTRDDLRRQLSGIARPAQPARPSDVEK
ncbi:MAG TPA: hypothetical protein VNF99_05150 [Stellaceae bacterium]|nr:hypothetical protein [Stellaceae bacterium]